MGEPFYNKSFCLEVWGDYACFTRPDLKVERMTYPCMTPSAKSTVGTVRHPPLTELTNAAAAGSDSMSISSYGIS